MKYIIVGGVAGGASFACRLRRLDEEAEIVIYEKSHFVSYANCGLPYYVSSTIPDKRSLTLQTPQSLKARFNIDVHVDNEVQSIDRKGHKITIRDVRTERIFEDHYDRLILSVGAEAIRLTENTERIFELKTVEDSLRIKEYLDIHESKEAIVIGGGFIGLEIAENLAESGLHVAILEGRDHVLANLDSEMAAYVHQELLRNGIDLHLSTMVQKIQDTGKEILVQTDKGTLKSDILIQAVGVRPCSRLAKECGLDLDVRSTIWTDAGFRTSDPDIFAIGDVVALDSALDGSRVNIALAGLANKEGRELANRLVGNEDPDIKAVGTSILKVFSLAAASTGFTEGQLIQKGISYDKIYLSPLNHATYYPGATPMTIKLLFSKEDYRVLGAQIVGQKGIDKRIDLFAMAIQFHIPAYELKRLELSYAPPFSSAKDPINMAGYMVENLKNGLVEQFFFDEVEKASKDPTIQIVDVRTPMEFALGHIDNSINIPVDSLRQNLQSLPKDKKIYLVCESAVRSYIALRMLTQRGFHCRHLAGGYRLYATWRKDLERK